MRQAATRWLSFVVCLRCLAFGQGEAKGPEMLAQQVVAALKSNNQQALENLAANRGEFKKYIWPTIASRVASGSMTADKFYSIYANNSAAALDQQLKTFGGKDLAIVKVTTGSEKRYGGYRLLPNPEIAVRDSSGQERIVRLGSALLDYGGTLKVASYYRAPSTLATQ